jgi:tubulin beta
MSALLSGGEIINVHLGGCGKNIANAFWQVLCKEHHWATLEGIGLSTKYDEQEQTEVSRSFTHHNTPFSAEWYRKNLKTQDIEFNGQAQDENNLSQRTSTHIQLLHSYFYETLGRYVPRALFIDQNCPPKSSYRSDHSDGLKYFFRPENFVSGYTNANGIYMQSNVLSQQPLLNITSEAMSAEIEKTDALQALQFTAHLGGGNGSTLSSATLKQFRDDIGHKTTFIMTSLLPSACDIGCQNYGLEIYNSVLCLPDIYEYCDMTCLIDNEALYDICFRLLNVHEPGWVDLNNIVATTLCCLSSCTRFPSLENINGSGRIQLRDIPLLLKQSYDNIPPFCLLGFSPFTPRTSNAHIGIFLKNNNLCTERSFPGEKKGFNSMLLHDANSYNSGTRMPCVKSLCQSLFRPSQFLSSIDPVGHFYMDSLVVLRGAFTQNDFEQEIHYTRVQAHSKYQQFHYYIPRNFSCRLCPVPSLNLNVSAMWATTSTAIGDYFKTLTNLYEQMLSRRVFCHLYHQEGLDESEFYHTLEKIRSIIDSYDFLLKNHLQTLIDLHQTKHDLGARSYNTMFLNSPELLLNSEEPFQIRWEA